MSGIAVAVSLPRRIGPQPPASFPHPSPPPKLALTEIRGNPTADVRNVRGNSGSCPEPEDHWCRLSFRNFSISPGNRLSTGEQRPPLMSRRCLRRPLSRDPDAVIVGAVHRCSNAPPGVIENLPSIVTSQ